MNTTTRSTEGPAANSASLREAATPFAQIVLGGSESGHSVSDTLFGLFLEDINFGLDGGLNANLVGNHSFDGVYLDPKDSNLFRTLVLRRPSGRIVEPFRSWTIRGAAPRSVAHEAPRTGLFLEVESAGGVEAVNSGVVGAEASMGFRAGVAYHFDALVRTDGGQALELALLGPDGRVLAEAHTQATSSDWQRVQASVTAPVDSLGSLRISLPSGRVALDDVRLIPEDHWGAGDPRWSQGVLRRDLVEAIRDVAPRFLRFPGGCIIEGLDLSNAFNWKNTVGPLERRVPDYNLWGLQRKDRGYSQSHQIGFYEMFLLCEDLGMQPLPVINAGLACQMRSNDRCEVGTVDWQEVVQSAIDLVDWATGDPATNEWAALRAEAGHPEPFELNMLGIGNENFGPEYFERFDQIAAAVTAHRPGIRYVLSAGAFPAGKSFDLAWKHAAGYGSELFVDEHFYRSPKWFHEQAVHRYDNYPRTGPAVFAGEYAARVPLDFGPKAIRPKPNTWQGAVAEAAFYTGLVRNSDIVQLSSYAPLFNRVGASQWGHNFIDFNAFTVQPTLNYHAQKLFAERIGSHTIAVSVSGASEVVASASMENDLVYVNLVNSGSSPATVGIELPPGRTASSALAWLLHEKPSAALQLGIADTTATVPEPERRELHITGSTLTLELPPHAVARLDLVLAGQE